MRLLNLSHVKRKPVLGVSHEAVHEASSTKVPPNWKQRESVKLKGSIKKVKEEPRDHHQTQHSPNSLALFATDSLELKLAYESMSKFVKF